MNEKFDSKKSEFKYPFGCVRQDEPCSLTLYIPRRLAATIVSVCIEQQKLSEHIHILMEWDGLEDGYDRYTGQFSLESCGLYYYYFHVHTTHSEYKLYKHGSNDTSRDSGSKWQLTCYDKHYDTSDSFKGKVYYQIFPDRFHAEGRCDLTDKLIPFSIHDNLDDVPHYEPDLNGLIANNDFYGGNLKGIIVKLPYLKKLHVSVIYLNPVFMAYSNHRYDTADYMRIDPMLGTSEDFVQLCKEAHRLDMKIILDGVFSHTGSNSIYFDKYDLHGEGAYHHAESPYREWYQFTEYPNHYVSWWGVDTLPTVNKQSVSYKHFIMENDNSVIRHWLRLGADGYRLDVADELSDDFIERLNAIVKEEKEDSIVIGEVWEDASNKVSYGVQRSYFSRRELDSVMNYPFKNAIIHYVCGESNAHQLADSIMTIAENYPKPILDCVMNLLSTHDTMRILTALGTHDHSLSKAEKASHRLSEQQLHTAIEREKIAAVLQFTLPGCPCIYYGDEVGLEGFEDPFNRRYFPWSHINYELLYFYRELGRIKGHYKALRLGSIRIAVEEEHVLGFMREYDCSRILVVINRGDELFEYGDLSGEMVLFNNSYLVEGTLSVGAQGFAVIDMQ